MKNLVSIGILVSCLTCVQHANAGQHANAATVVDRNGVVIGSYFPTETPQPWLADGVLLSIGKIQIILPFTAAGFLPTPILVSYTTSDCSGQAYVGEPLRLDNLSGIGHVERANQDFGIDVKGNLYYVSSFTPALAAGTLLGSQGLVDTCSSYTPDTPAFSCQFQCTTTPSSVAGTPLWPVATFSLATLGFKPPFSVAQEMLGD